MALFGLVSGLYYCNRLLGGKGLDQKADWDESNSSFLGDREL